MSQSRDHITILLAHTPEAATKQFKCIDCGTVVFEYQGDVISVTEGELAKNMVGSLILCDGQKITCEGGEWTSKKCLECGERHKVCVNGEVTKQKCGYKYWIS